MFSDPELAGLWREDDVLAMLLLHQRLLLRRKAEGETTDGGRWEQHIDVLPRDYTSVLYFKYVVCYRAGGL